ncbi:MAG: kinesin, partial [Bosea sp. (in: a-proteobacteria)]
APAPAAAPAPVAEAPRRPVAAEPAGPAKGGWLSDLLNRASREEKAPEAPKPTAHSIERLDSLSVDIARMIDHDAAVELWDRYKRGERNVFTRRLYTLQGQQTFDEIRRKYRRDAEFKETVDRYIDEFERLLAEAAKDDRDSMVAKTYLTSETGKVYTMLAHASGRFE